MMDLQAFKLDVMQKIMNARTEAQLVKTDQLPDQELIVRSFKMLYTEKDDTIYIVDIVSTKQSPEVLETSDRNL